jgi:hypothetical protein
MTTDRPLLNKVLSGVAGEYFVAAELSRRGYVASITLRNTRGIDILASNANATRSTGIQVKTNQTTTREWILNRKAETNLAENLCYVFVALNGLGVPSFHVVPSSVVAQFVTEGHRNWLAGTRRDGAKRVDTAIRNFNDFDGRYLDRWDILGLDTPI